MNDFNTHVEQALAIANRQAPEKPEGSAHRPPLAWRLAVIAGKVFAVSACLTGLAHMFLRPEIAQALGIGNE